MTEETYVRRGDVVRVRSREEILATLDADGAVAHVPFMPEMLKYAGMELPVQARAHKGCDTVEHLGQLREMDNAVHLQGARCDGSAHGGCQANCLLFFREEWLEKDGKPLKTPAPAQGPTTPVDRLDEVTTRVNADGDTVYHCQATAMRQASRPATSRDHFKEDIRSGNVTRARLFIGLLTAAFNKYQWSSRKFPKWMRLFGGQAYPFYQGVGNGKRVAAGELQPGDLVEVRSKKEIMATLNPNNKNGGMLFDAEALPFCGRQARVARKVDQIIDEPTGRMIKLQDCLVLEGVNCMGIYHRNCPRDGEPYWREAWLKKVEQ